MSKVSPPAPRTIPPLEPDCLTKITFHVRVKQKQGESNAFLRAMQAYPPLGPVFLAKIACSMRVKHNLGECYPFMRANQAHQPF